jgi:hypothetical protein
MFFRTSSPNDTTPADLRPVVVACDAAMADAEAARGEALRFVHPEGRPPVSPRPPRRRWQGRVGRVAGADRRLSLPRRERRSRGRRRARPCRSARSRCRQGPPRSRPRERSRRAARSPQTGTDAAPCRPFPCVREPSSRDGVPSRGERATAWARPGPDLRRRARVSGTPIVTSRCRSRRAGRRSRPQPWRR